MIFWHFSVFLLNITLEGTPWTLLSLFSAEITEYQVPKDIKIRQTDQYTWTTSQTEHLDKYTTWMSLNIQPNALHMPGFKFQQGLTIVPSRTFLHIFQSKTKSLRSYMQQFNEASLRVVNFSDQSAISSFAKNVRKEKPYNFLVNIVKPNTLQK